MIGFTLGAIARGNLRALMVTDEAVDLMRERAQTEKRTMIVMPFLLLWACWLLTDWPLQGGPMAWFFGLSFMLVATALCWTLAVAASWLAMLLEPMPAQWKGAGLRRMTEASSHAAWIYNNVRQQGRGLRRLDVLAMRQAEEAGLRGRPVVSPFYSRSEGAEAKERQEDRPHE